MGITNLFTNMDNVNSLWRNKGFKVIDVHQETEISMDRVGKTRSRHAAGT